MANHDTRLYCLQQSSVLVKKQSSIATVAIQACLVGGLSQATASRQQSGPQAKKIDGLRILPGPGSKSKAKTKQALHADRYIPEIAQPPTSKNRLLVFVLGNN